MKKIFFVIAILAIIAVSISLVACKTTPSGNEVVVGSENTLPVSEAMNTVYEAMQHACTTDGATEGIYVSFSGEKKSVDETVTVNPKPILYDFSAKAYIDNDNLSSDSKSTMAFTVKEENGRTLFSMYYANGNLYIDYPPIFNKAAIDGVELGKVFNDLNQSKLHDGKVKVIADLIPVIGNYVFTSSKMTVLDKCDDPTCNCKNHFEYSCTLDLGKLYNALESVLTSTRLGITADMVLEALNLTRSDLNYLSTLKTTVIFNLYNMRGGDNYYYFKGVQYDKKEATVVDSFSLTNFVATEFTSEVASEYKVVLADNLSSYRKFDFANYDLSGELSFVINSTTNADNTLFGRPIKTNFVKNTFTCNYTFKSNYANGKLTAYLILGNMFGENKNIALYFDGDNLFVNAKDYLGNAADNSGLIKLSKEFVKDKLKVLTLLSEEKNNIDDDIVYFLTSIMQGLDYSEDNTQIELNKDTLDMITGLLGIDFAFDYQGAELYLNTESNLFKSVELKLVSNGISLLMTANNPKIGYEVLVNEPEWAKNAVEWNSLSRVTPIISGSIQTNINGVSNTKLVESLIYSLTGSEVVLEKPISKFTAESNYSTTGELEIFKLSFYGSDGFVCSLYYYTANQENRSNDLFVILPEADGKTPVLSLKLLENSRYSSFLNTINGNALVIQGNSEVILSNDSDGVELTANREGVSDIFELLKALFPDFYLNELPIDFSIDHISLSMGEQLLISTVFGQNKYINLSIDDITLDYYSLALKTYELTGHANRTVSIFDDNDMANTVTVQMYGKQESELVLDVEDFGGWHYDSTPILGSGVQEVKAYLNLFGQRVNETIRIDCSDAKEYKVKFDYEYAEYVDNQNKSFNFDKYASNVDPILVISEKFNSVDLLVNNLYINKKAVWNYNGKPIDQASFGKGNKFTVTPSLYGFFGQLIELTSCSYTLTLSNVEIQGIENADSFLTIYAYDTFDPLDSLTYSKVDPYILTTDGNKFKSHLEWNIASITNQTIKKNGVLLSNEELIKELKESFYMLDGNYKITASLKNSLGHETELTAIITVENRIIQQTSLKNLADGVSFEAYDSGDIKGIIVFDTAKINSLGAETVIAKAVECSYGSVTKTETTMKWEIPVVNNVPLYSETATNGELAVVLGDSIGGYQSFKYHYIFKNYKVNKLSLMSGDIVVSENSDGNKTTVIELLAQNPYSFAFPTSVVFDYDAFTLSYNDFYKDYELGSIVCDNIDWNMISLVENEIWHKGEDVIYTGSFQLADYKVELKLSFVSAIVDSWQFLNSDGVVVSKDQPLLMTDTYQFDENGEYVLIDGRFVLDDAHRELPHYSKIAENNGAVYYKKAEINDTVDSLVIDPNKSSYLSLDSYPSQAQVTFKNINDGNGTPIEFKLSIVWDLSKLASADIHSSGYYETVPVYIAYDQKLADVHLWISGQDPSDYFFVFDSEGKPHNGDITDGIKSNTISLKLLNTDQDGNLYVKNLNDIKTIHDMICGCSEENCLGRIYFDYNDANTSDGWFTITSWEGLEQIAELYQTQIANGVAVDEVSGNINVTAKVGNIICSKLTISIEPSKITTPSYEDYQPLVNSSINNSSADVYSMHASGTTLTVDPYLANAKDPSNYPQKVSFYLDGNKTVSVIDDWDCSCFDNVDMYKGAVGTVNALINTPFGDVKIISETRIRARIIELVLVDGSSSPIINVNIFAENPYGENVVEKNGRLIAYKRVEVKFVNDDSFYPMTLKYDITDFTATSSGGTIAQNINVYVGNEAGGYQLKTGYSVYSTQNTILSISSDSASVIAYLADGKIFTQENGFVSFDKTGDEAILANAAWKDLLVNVDKLIVEYFYFDKGIEVKQTVNANKIQGNTGLTFTWDRMVISDNEYVVLKLWNGRTTVGDVGKVLTLNTLSNKKIILFDSDFTLNTLTTEKEYLDSYTVADYLNDNIVESVPNTMISTKDIIVKLYDAEQNELKLDTVLTVGSYTVKVTVADDRFTITNESGVEKQLVINQKQITELSIKNGDKDIYTASHSYEIYEGAPIALAASNAYGVEIEINVVDEMGNTVTTPEAVGTYTITFVSKDSNYTIVDNVYTLTIKPLAEV